MFLNKLYLCFKSLITLIIKKKNNSFIIYSENIYYFSLYQKIVENISDENVDITYLTSDLDEFRYLQKFKLKKYFIGSGIIRALIFFYIKSNVFLLSLSDLDNYELKRSKNTKYYFYLFHSLQSSHVQYKYNAFKNYDYIFCNGEYHLNEIRKSENLFKFKEKKCILAGNTYFDYLLSKKNSLKNNPTSILVAPSWNLNKKNFLSDYSVELIENILNQNFRCIFRPHPMHYKKNKKILKIIEKKFLNNNNFKFDRERDNLNSLLNSKVLITDNSGIANEFLLVFGRPVVYFNFAQKIHNEDYRKLNIQSFEEKVKNEFGYLIEPKDIRNINDHLNKVISNKINQKILDEFIKIYISNVGSSANIIANEIKNKLNNNL
jgi:hypothetical protein